MSEIVTQTLGINCSMTMLFGGTILDTDPTAGYDQSEMETVRKPSIRSPIAALNLYPEAIGVERDSGVKDEENLALAATWNNGFIPFSRGLPDPENMSRSCQTYLKTQNIVTTDQAILSRPDGWMEALFWHFQWYGSKGERIIDEEFVKESIVGKLVQQGLVCRKWAYNPVSVRYMVRIKSDDDEIPDYVYFIGGSDDLINDDLKVAIKKIQSDYKEATHFFEESAKSTNKTASEIGFRSDLSDPKNTWVAFNSGNETEEMVSAPITKARLAFKRMSRTIQGIFYIRNYLLYAKDFLCVDSLVEVDYNKKKKFNKVDIKEVLERYEDAYQYCKNLCYIYPNIGEGVFE